MLKRSTAIAATGREEWQYQLRVELAEDAAAAARAGREHVGLGPLREILAAHDARLICQYDAFAGYCAEAEARGIEHYPLYAWTKAVIADPVKQAKYVKSFSIHVGGAEVYARDAGRTRWRPRSRRWWAPAW